jgi:hypothetical protein
MANIGETAMKKALLFCVGVGAAIVAATQSASAATPTTSISSTPSAFDTTNGDILAIAKVNGAPQAELAIGGNFTSVKTPDGASHAATDFAVLNQATGAVLYAGKANSYVRTIASFGGTIYAGGDFTTFAGLARPHLVALDPSFAVTSFNPAPKARVRAIAADGSGVYYGGDLSTVQKVNAATAKVIWSKPISGGSTKALKLTSDGATIFVGGLFETYAGVTQHGLIKASASTGAMNTSFNDHLRVDSGVGQFGAFDGEEAVSFALTPEGTNLIVGLGGHGSDEVRKVNITTGARVWNRVLIGDCQAVVPVGNTYVVGYHRNSANADPYYAEQLEGSNDAKTSWDPKVTGTQSNADGGNNGVQAAWADPVTKVLYLGGAFTHYNGVAGHQSLVAFSYS